MPEITAPDQKLGLTIPVGAGHLSELGQALDVAADSGYTDVWSSEVSGSDAFTPLVLAAMLRPELRLGSAIIPAYTRGAATLAMSVASLADTAKGDVLVGIGSSSNIIVEKWNGIPFADPYYQTRDMVRFLKEALTGEKVNFEGRTFKIDGFRLGLVPEKQPKILVAALRSGMLSMAGREADGAILNYLTADDVTKVVPYVLDHNPDAEIVARIFVIPTTDIEAGQAIARRQIAAYLNVPVYAAFHDWLGRSAELDQMWSMWSQGDRPHALEAVPEHLIGEMFLTGDPATIAEGVKRYVDAGVTTPMLAVISLDRNPQATLDAVAQLGTAIRSALGGSPPSRHGAAPRSADGAV
jgi:probable F420-dependent oxidoreductase